MEIDIILFNLCRARFNGSTRCKSSMEHIFPNSMEQTNHTLLDGQPLFVNRTNNVNIQILKLILLYIFELVLNQVQVDHMVS